MNDRLPTSGYAEERTREVDAPREVLWEVVAGIGGESGWYAFDAFWQARAALDRLLGGPGMRGRGRELRAGDAVDFWRVVDVEDSHRLLLRAELPGHKLVFRRMLDNLAREAEDRSS